MFLSTGELCHVLMGRSAASKLRRKSQREAEELTFNKFFQDTLAMEEEELAREEEQEVVFKKRRTVPDTPRASRANTPDPEEKEEELPAVRPGAASGEVCARPDTSPGHR